MVVPVDLRAPIAAVVSSVNPFYEVSSWGPAVNDFVSFPLDFKPSAGIEERSWRGTEFLRVEEDFICKTAWVAKYGGFIYRKLPKSASSIC
jgi:hypothetical protein